jgi:glucoamylase
VLHFGFDGWQQVTERTALAQPFGLWGVRLSVQELALFAELNFTRRYDGGWEGEDHRVTLGHDEVVHTLQPMGGAFAGT